MEVARGKAVVSEGGVLRFDDFEPWFADIVEDFRPGLIISVARGAVRFMQLHLSQQLQGTVRHLSHHAIPFIRREELEDMRVLVFDDSVIFGSTMSSVKERLERRGAQVLCTSYVVDRMHFFGDTPPRSRESAKPSPYSTLPLSSKHHLWADEVRRHHALLVRSVLHTGLHYNLDFPTFCIRLQDCCVQDASYISYLLKKAACFRAIADVSSPLGMEGLIPRYSALLNHESCEWLRCGSVTFRPYGKVRITYVPRQNAILVTPILQLAMREGTSFGDIIFSRPDANQLWRTLVAPQEMNSDSSSRGLFRLATAFAGIALGVSVCDDIVSAIEKDYRVVSTTLEPFDMRVVLGEENSEALTNMWDYLACQSPRALRGDSNGSGSGPVELPNAPRLRSQIKDVFRRNSSLAPDKNDLLCESVGRVFLAIRAVTDSEMVRRSHPSPDRLNTGLTYEGIRSVLFDATGCQPAGDELSFCIDLCVDQGLAVPKIVRENGMWFRAFYCGENEDNQMTLQLKDALHRAYTAYLKKRGSQHLTPFDFQKLCVAMKDVLPWIPISIAPYRFGYTSTVGSEQLISWLTKGHSPFAEKWEGDRRIITAKREFQSPVTCIWEPARLRDFLDAFDFTASAFRKIPDEAKLLVTTCRTHRHTFNAIAFELWLWMGYQELSFGAFLVGLDRTLLLQEQGETDVLCSLYWSIRYVSEAWKKHRIFAKEYASILKTLKKGFCSSGPAGERWWHFLCAKNLFDPTPDPDMEKRFDCIMPILQQMTRLTAFTVNLLLESSILPRDALQEVFRREGVLLEFSEFDWLTRASWLAAGKEYNDAISSGHLPGKSILTTPVMLPQDGHLSRTQVSLTMQGVRACLDEISDAIRTFCPRYCVNEGDFPFSPTRDRRHLEDGSIERDLRNVYILTLDIIKGTNSEQTNEMKAQIRQVLQDFTQKGLVFEDTGNDAFIACCHNVMVLWDAADAIRIRGEALILPGDPLAGTRKGLYFGSLTVLTKVNGETLLHDLRKTNVIPAAFYILPGIDSHVSPEKRNSAIIMPERLLEQCADKLKLDRSTAIRVVLDEKHFKNACYIVYLT